MNANQRIPTTIERQAGALDELRQLHQNYASLVAKVEEDRRTMDRQLDRIEMLEQDLAEAKNLERVVTRKLIRLAGAMTNINLLTGEAAEIMRSAKEYLDETPEQSEQETESARQAVARLPQRV